MYPAAAFGSQDGDEATCCAATTTIAKPATRPARRVDTNALHHRGRGGRGEKARCFMRFDLRVLGVHRSGALDQFPYLLNSASRTTIASAVRLIVSAAVSKLLAM